MPPVAKLGAFGLALVVAFAAAYGVGQAVGPVDQPATETAAHGHDGSAPHAEVLPAGLRVSADGYTLDVVDPRGFAFRILDDRGAPVTRFTRAHDKLMHLIVARRDLSGYQHLHPELDADGTWRIPLDFGAAGEFRVFADFLPAGRDESITLGVDVPVPGAFSPRPLPAPSRTATVDGYQVSIAGHLDAGTTSPLTLSVTRAGERVDLEPYLGAYGHLVALRHGDLAYLHVHPDAGASNDIRFYAEVPSVGTYRLYLDFKHAGVVRTAEFTTIAESHEEGP
ncbi:hypothetical protein [Actinophytocola sediminis]